MNIGTKSLLFGVHQVFIHPWFVAWGWWKLYGFPWDPRLWVAFFVHDLGYWGKPNMDGPDGELHPYLGARIMGKLFGGNWFDFTLLHSRFLSMAVYRLPSRLCFADKMAIKLTPWWLYIPLAKLSGELSEYMHAKHARTPAGKRSPREWLEHIQHRCGKWAENNKNKASL